MTVDDLETPNPDRPVLCFLVIVRRDSCIAMSQASLPANTVPAEQIDGIFAGINSTRAPGAAVLVLQNGQVIFERGYGVADLHSFPKIDAHTNFRLASCTKQFTAMAIMLLVHDGKLRYQDRLTDIFPDFPDYGKAITIRNLLNHTSGLLDYEDLMEKPAASTPPKKFRQIKDAGVLAILKRQKTTKFPPGTKWDYSNSGYAVLAMVVQKVSGKPFGDFLHDRIFAPLKMTETVAYEKEKNSVSLAPTVIRTRTVPGTDGLAGTGPEFNFGRVRRWWRLFIAHRPCEVGSGAHQSRTLERSRNEAGHYACKNFRPQCPGT